MKFYHTHHPNNNHSIMTTMSDEKRFWEFINASNPDLIKTWKTHGHQIDCPICMETKTSYDAAICERGHVAACKECKNNRITSITDRRCPICREPDAVKVPSLLTSLEERVGDLERERNELDIFSQQLIDELRAHQMRVLVANRPSSPRPRLMQTTNSPTNEPRQVPTSPVPADLIHQRLTTTMTPSSLNRILIRSMLVRLRFKTMSVAVSRGHMSNPYSFLIPTISIEFVLDSTS